MAEDDLDRAAAPGRTINATASKSQRDQRNMKVACLQFAPQVGQIKENIRRAEAVLARDMVPGIDWIILPEMAFSGYSFSDKVHIEPFLEPTAQGITTEWAKQTAKRYSCAVSVGYPEVAKPIVFLSSEAISVFGDLVHAPVLRPFLSQMSQLSSHDLQEFVDTAKADSDCLGLLNADAIARLCEKARQLGLEVSPETLLLGMRPLFYNALVTVSESGDIVNHYRKSFLYYTDETWSEEGPGFPPILPDGRLPEQLAKYKHVIDDNFDIYVDESHQQGQASKYRQTSSPFFSGNIPTIGQTTLGICMDINPYRFATPYSVCEFANAALKADSPIIVVSMAWLTMLSRESLNTVPSIPDEDTILYWAERFEPIRQATAGKGYAGEKIVICGNRCGMEDHVSYAGSSTVFRFRDGRTFILDMLGRYQEKLMIVNLDQVRLRC